MVTDSRVVLSLSACAVTLLTSVPAWAARIETGAACSLVDAISSANTNAAVGGCVAGVVGNDTVVLIGTTTLSAPDNGSNGLPVITENLIITSPDPATSSSISRDPALGTPDFRLLEIGNGALAPTVTLRRLNLARGRVVGSLTLGGIPAAGAGGCILLRNGSLTIVDSVIEECAAVGIDNANGPAGEAWGGAIAAIAGSLTIRGSSFSFNTATGGNTGIAGQPGGSAEGGAIFASGATPLTIRDSSVSSSFATGGTGVSRAGNGRGGGLSYFGTRDGTLIGVSFSANAASGGVASNGTSGTGIGGGIAVEGPALAITDSDLTSNVVNGADSATGLAGYAFGGGLYGSASTISFADTTISDNRANGGGGVSASFNGLARGGGLHLFEAPTTADGVTVNSNAITGANPQGAGIIVLHDNAPATPFLMTHSSVIANVATATQGSAEGGGVYQDGDTVTIRNTTIDANSADTGGGLFQETGASVITLSTFSGNSATIRGGAIALDGTFTVDNSLDLSNVTVSGNTAGVEGGGIDIVGAQAAPAATTVELSNVTITANTNGGIRLEHDRSDPVLEVGNSIVGGQGSGLDCTIDGSAIITSDGGNLESATSCELSTASDQQSIADLGLTALGSHGGTTLTHDILPGSPAIDAGGARICRREANDKDQRGLARFYDGDGDRDFACDSGAVEAQGLLANPGFEEPLNSASDWLLVASGGGDGRVASMAAPSGRFALQLQGNGALETLSQTVPVAGAAGEIYTLTLQALGSGLPAGGAVAITLQSRLAGGVVNSATCSFFLPANAFSGTPACRLAAAAAFDSMDVALTWDGVAAGNLMLDAISLVRE